MARMSHGRSYSRVRMRRYFVPPPCLAPYLLPVAFLVGVTLGYVFQTGLALAVPLLLVGGLRADWTFDRHTRRIDRWWGFLWFPVRRDVVQVGGDVVLALEECTGLWSGSPVFRLRIDLCDQCVVIDESWRLRRARRLGTEIARCFEIPLEDRCAGKVIDGAELNKPLGVRLREAGTAEPSPPVPRGLSLRSSGEHLVLELRRDPVRVTWEFYVSAILQVVQFFVPILGLLIVVHVARRFGAPIP